MNSKIINGIKKVDSKSFGCGMCVSGIFVTIICPNPIYRKIIVIIAYSTTMCILAKNKQ